VDTGGSAEHALKMRDRKFDNRAYGSQHGHHLVEQAFTLSLAPEKTK
jgi:hypothetical protein